MLISQTNEWKALQKHYNIISQSNMRQMFELDSERFSKLSFKYDDVFFDYSKNIISEETIKLLKELADRAELDRKISDMMDGEKINTTERRAVLHTALRNLGGKPIRLDGTDVMQGINAVKSHIRQFSEAVRSGEWKGATGKKITDIVNIGIGGSDLGPAMIAAALKPFSGDVVNAHFVSNVDSTDIVETLKKLKPESTLFIIASKTFTTQETMTNAQTAKDWFIKNFASSIKDMEKHFVALSTNEAACAEFGINRENMFHFWDWVGGRYSLWSAIGLSIAIYVGYDNFEQLLLGGYLADEHYRNSPFEQNIPKLMGMLSIWYNNFFGAASHAVIGYDQYLVRFAEFLQQLDMESLGKSVTLDGEKVNFETGQILWGTIGTNSQHSFFQLIHQGTRLIPADFIAAVRSPNERGEHREILLSNFFAQTEALMKGKNRDEVYAELKEQFGSDEEQIQYLLPHKVFEGNRPTNTFLLKELTPKTLGMLIAFYEQKVFTEGAVWNINPFDQWGVELGKQLAKRILPELKSPGSIYSHDSSTNGLINRYKSWK